MWKFESEGIALFRQLIFIIKRQDILLILLEERDSDILNISAKTTFRKYLIDDAIHQEPLVRHQFPTSAPVGEVLAVVAEQIVRAKFCAD